MSITSSLLELLIIIGIGLAIPGPNALTSFAHSGLFGKKSNKAEMDFVLFRHVN